MPRSTQMHVHVITKKLHTKKP